MVVDKMLLQLPHNESRRLCQILDWNGSWKVLAEKYMRYDMITIKDLCQKTDRKISPTEKLLMMWGSLNHSVLELFYLLYKMQQFQAMEVIKYHVDEEYHYLIQSDEENQIRLLEESHNENSAVRQEFRMENRNEEAMPENIHPNVEHDLINLWSYVLDNESNSIGVQSLRSNSLHSVNTADYFSTTCFTLASGISHGVNSTCLIPQRPYDEIQRYAYNWDPRRILGRGGFATVWYGVWNCTQVAIKRIEPRGKDSLDSYLDKFRKPLMELHYMNFYRHDNILSVYGYSFNGPHPCILYQYMPGGSLEYRLRTQDSLKYLNWSKRLNIAIETARGLQFLHNSHIPLIHNDIKSGNILLDSNDNPKIADFGLASEGPRSNNSYIKVSKPQGTRAYLPHDYLQSLKLSTKVDTYSFGVVLFEIATGLCASSENRINKYLKDHVVNYMGDINDLKDTRIENSDTAYKGLIDIGKLCTNSKAKCRPDMIRVLILLEEIAL